MRYNQVKTMKRMMTMCVAAGMLAGMAGSAIAGGQIPVDQLQGDQKTACEALMCLTAPGSTPSECNESLRKYFSIHASKPSDLKKKRKNFLKLCPTDGETDDLVDSVVNGKCNAKYQDCSTPTPPVNEPDPDRCLTRTGKNICAKEAL